MASLVDFGFSDDEIAALAPAIGHHRRLSSLRIVDAARFPPAVNRRRSERGVVHLVSALGHSRTLQHVTVDSNPVDVATEFCEALSVALNYNYTLAELRLPIVVRDDMQGRVHDALMSSTLRIITSWEDKIRVSPALRNRLRQRRPHPLSSVSQPAKTLGIPAEREYVAVVDWVRQFAASSMKYEVERYGLPTAVYRCVASRFVLPRNAWRVTAELRIGDAVIGTQGVLRLYRRGTPRDCVRMLVSEWAEERSNRSAHRQATGGGGQPAARGSAELTVFGGLPRAALAEVLRQTYTPHHTMPEAAGVPGCIDCALGVA